MSNSKKVKKIDLVNVDDMRIDHTINIYFEWKQLDARVRTLSTRGLNFPSELSENLVCFAAGLLLNKGSAGDAFDPVTNKIYEIKGTSTIENDDLSSFSPSEEFDELIFAELNRFNDSVDIYFTGMNSEKLKLIKVNKTETLKQKQEKGQRPRFSIKKKIIEPNNLRPTYTFDLRKRKVIKNNT